MNNKLTAEVGRPRHDLQRQQERVGFVCHRRSLIDKNVRGDV